MAKIGQNIWKVREAVCFCDLGHYQGLSVIIRQKAKTDNLSSHFCQIFNSGCFCKVPWNKIDKLLKKNLVIFSILNEKEVKMRMSYFINSDEFIVDRFKAIAHNFCYLFGHIVWQNLLIKLSYLLYKFR